MWPRRVELEELGQLGELETRIAVVRIARKFSVFWGWRWRRGRSNGIWDVGILRVVGRQRWRPRCRGCIGEPRSDWAGENVFIITKYKLKLETILWGGEKIKRSVADIIASKQSGNPVKIGKLTLLVKQGVLE